MLKASQIIKELQTLVDEGKDYDVLVGNNVLRHSALSVACDELDENHKFIYILSYEK